MFFYFAAVTWSTMRVIKTIVGTDWLKGIFSGGADASMTFVKQPRLDDQVTILMCEVAGVHYPNHNPDPNPNPNVITVALIPAPSTCLPWLAACT